MLNTTLLDRDQSTRLEVYRRGYSPEDRGDTPLYSLPIPTELLSLESRFSFRTLELAAVYGQTDVYLGGICLNPKKEGLPLYPEIAVCPENDGMGDMVAKGAISAYVIPAEDGESAKGLWLTPGICSEVNLDGRPKGTYMHEKVGLNVVREPDGSWKILKLRTYVDFVTPIPTEWLEMEPNAGSRTFHFSPEEDKKPEDEPPRFGPGKKPYSITTKAGYYPPLPEPYQTFGEDTAMVKL